MASKYYSLAEGYQRSREAGDRRPAQEPDSRRHFKRKENEKRRGERRNGRPAQAPDSRPVQERRGASNGGT